MLKSIFTLFCGISFFTSLFSQNETWIGVRSQFDVNLYRYFEGSNNPYATSFRQTYGHTSGLALKYSALHFLHLRGGIQFSEATYLPNVLNNYGVLSSVYVRSVNVPLGIDFLFNSGKKLQPYLGFSFETLFRNRLRESYSKTLVENPPPVWSATRCMMQWHLGFSKNIGKKYHLSAETGIRLGLNNATQFDKGVNKFFIGLAFHRQLR